MSTINYKKFATNSFLLRLSFLGTLPAAFFAGLRVKEVSDEKVVTSVKYSWFTKNPFQSVYFACLAMAAELSTGLLLLNFTSDSQPAISTLIVKNESFFYKKAVGTILFTCIDGAFMKEKVQYAKTSGEAVLIEATSTGRDQQGDVVAEFKFTWSIKAKKS
jgi:phage terminase large subunit-like protein